MSTSIREANIRFALLKVVADAVLAEMGTLRAEHTERLVKRYHDEGTKSFTVALGDGTKVATVTLAESKAATVVADEAAFIDWCRVHHPEALATVTHPAEPERVVPAREAWTEQSLHPKASTALLAALRQVDGGALVDPDTGVLVDGLEHRPAEAPKSFSVRYSPDGRERLAVAWRAGDLDAVVGASVLPQLGGAA